MSMPNIPGYNNDMLIAGEGLSMGVNDTINTKIIGHTLHSSLNLVKPSPTQRIPIDNQINVSEDIKHTTIPKQQSSRATSTSMMKANLTRAASMMDQYGVIYSTEQRRLSEHEDMKTLLIVSGMLAGLGYMYFNS